MSKSLTDLIAQVDVPLLRAQVASFRAYCLPQFELLKQAMIPGDTINITIAAPEDAACFDDVRITADMKGHFYLKYNGREAEELHPNKSAIGTLSVFMNHFEELLSACLSRFEYYESVFSGAAVVDIAFPYPYDLAAGHTSIVLANSTLLQIFNQYTLADKKILDDEVGSWVISQLEQRGWTDWLWSHSLQSTGHLRLSTIPLSDKPAVEPKT